MIVFGSLGRKRSLGRFESRATGIEGLETRVLLHASIAVGQEASDTRQCTDQDCYHVIEQGHYYGTDDGRPIQLAAQALAAEPGPGLSVAAAGSSSTSLLDAVPVRHSHPSARQSIYLDFDGQIVTNTDWNDLNQGRAIYAPAFDADGDAKSFSRLELAAIDQIWQRVAEDYAPFDVDVTTQEPANVDFVHGNRAIRVVVSSNVDERTGNRWFKNVGGVGYVGSWRWKTDTPVWVFESNMHDDVVRIAEAVSHEVGHAMGLSHDGVDELEDREGEIGEGDEYFKGHGEGDVSWAPIMGTAYSKQVTQWSRGEYAGANSQQDDLSVITSAANQVSYREDDHAASLGYATPFVSSRSGDVNMSGIIERNSDLDTFVFDTVGGRVELEFLPASNGANLDVQAVLFNSHGQVISTANPAHTLSAEIRMDLAPGRYYVMVDGVGEGDPAIDGYSDYGSLGKYSITGSITGSILAAPLNAPSSRPPLRPVVVPPSPTPEIDAHTPTDLPAKLVALQTARRHLVLMQARRTAAHAQLVKELAAQKLSFGEMLEMLATWVPESAE